MNRYCIDTNIIIDLWNQTGGTYPKDVFQSLWTAFENLVKDGTIVSVKDVYDELKEEKDKELKSWLVSNKDMFLDVDDCTLQNLKEILVKYPMLAEGYSNGADPVIVSLAMCKDLTVITSESFQTSSSPYTPKIPNLCKEKNVECLDIIGFCRKEAIHL